MSQIQIHFKSEVCKNIFILLIRAASHLLHCEKGFVCLLCDAVKFDFVVLQFELFQTDLVRQSHSHLSVDWHPVNQALLHYSIFAELLSVETHPIVEKNQKFVLQEGFNFLE